MFKVYISVFIFLLVQVAYAQQPPVLQWAKGFLSDNQSNLSNGRTIGVDKQGNVYSAGVLQYNLDLDPGPGTFNLTAIGVSVQPFIAKLSSNAI